MFRKVKKKKIPVDNIKLAIKKGDPTSGKKEVF